MKNWVSTTCQKVWRRITHPLQKSANLKDGRPTSTPIAVRADLRQAPGPCPNFLVPPTVANSRDASDRRDYLLERENSRHDIDKLSDLLEMPQVLLEIGCGNAEAARKIALKNPAMGVIATDIYDWSHEPNSGSSYGQIAQEWRARRLPAQVDTLANLVILKAETDLLFGLPTHAIDTVILINPEPQAGRAILDLLQGEYLSMRLKQGTRQIVILPYSREMGVMTCGGCEFEHDSDWSRGLGFIMGSGLRFRRGASIQWGVDLSRISAYTGNSTQRDIYIHGQKLAG